MTSVQAFRAFRRHVRRLDSLTLIRAEDDLYRAYCRAHLQGASGCYVFWLVRCRREVVDALNHRYHPRKRVW